jgi:hypothetical protein
MLAALLLLLGVSFKSFSAATLQQQIFPLTYCMMSLEVSS